MEHEKDNNSLDKAQLHLQTMRSFPLKKACLRIPRWVVCKKLKLMDSIFCIVWARMNHIEMCLMILSQKADSKLLRMAS